MSCTIGWYKENLNYLSVKPDACGEREVLKGFANLFDLSS